MRRMLVALDQTLDRRVQRIPRGIEYVMLRQTINLREEQKGFEPCVRPPRVAQVPPELLVNLLNPWLEQRVKVCEHFVLHADAVRQRPEITTLADHCTDRAQQRRQPEAGVWFGIGACPRLAHIANAVLENRDHQLSLAG